MSTQVINSDIIGTVQMNIVRERWLKERMNKITKEMKYRKAFLTMYLVEKKKKSRN